MKQLFLITVLTVVAGSASAGHHEETQTPVMSEAEIMQKVMEAGQPGEPHAKLAEGVGEYDATMAFYMDPDGEPMTTTMKVTRAMTLDGRVLVEHWEGVSMGRPFKGEGRTGYDNVTGQYWTTWNDNWSTGVLMMHGEWDEAEEAIVFRGEGTNPATGTKYKSRSVAKYPAPGKETMVMYEDYGAGEFRTMEFSLTKVAD